MQLKRKLKKLVNGIKDFFRAIFWVFTTIVLILWTFFIPLPEEYE